MIDIQVVFKGSIKPSVPTPDHLRHYQLSFLDQIKASYFMPMILFYSQEPRTNILTKEQRSDMLLIIKAILFIFLIEKSLTFQILQLIK